YVNRQTEPTEYIIYSNRLLAAAREVLKRSRNLGLAYLITKDEAYAERLWTEINHCCTVWQDWHNYHFLDTGETTMAVAMAYDWLYDYWTPEQRKIMETAIVERALEAIMEDYLEIPGRDRANTPPGWVNYKNNWNLVCGGGVSAGALAILDSDPEYAELCGNVLEHMLVDIEESLENYAPDGGYVEGASYWNYAGIYLAYLTQNLMTAAGDDYGIMRTPGLDTTAYFNLDMASSGGVFNFSDCGTYDLVDPAAYWYSNAYRDPVLQATIRSVEEGQTSDDGLSVHRVLFYDPKLEADVGVKLPLNAKYDNAGVVTMRDNRELSDNYLIGFRSGDNSADHHHQDGGTFIIDMNGVRFAKDFGAGTYNEAGTYHRYRYSAQGHNTWVINPDMTSFSQVDKARAHIDKYEANDYEGYAISDLSNLYRGKIDSIRRGVRALEGKKVFVVEDELKSANPVEAYWQMHTTADIQILEGGKQAVMTIGEDQMVATLLTDNDAVFETHAAEPYEGTPNYPVSDSQADTTKLIIHLTNVTDERVAVEFRHIYKGEEIPTKHVEVEPLDAWSLNDGTYEEDPKLTDLKINGETVDGFASGKRNYKASVKWEELDALKVTADGDEDGEVTVRYPKNYPGTILAKVTKGEQSTTYAIKVDVIYDLSVWNDSKRLEIKGLSASDEPQPENCKENVLDGDYNTRWSAKDRNWIDFDLGKAKQVDYITLAFMSGDQRIAYLEVATSDDGIEWTTRYSGQSSGKTLDDEKFPVGAKSARYVRVVVAGTSVSRVGWNSVTEFKAFGK
ncbi:MAG: discoidin domain-containing protein, partial [Clostridia bacterium]|nr:discoidin domain-containing protein [Clostridia bacterium]